MLWKNPLTVAGNVLVTVTNRNYNCVKEDGNLNISTVWEIKNGKLCSKKYFNVGVDS